MISNVTVIQGTAYRIEKRNLDRNAVTAFADGTLILHTEVVIDGEVEMLEVWLAEPEVWLAEPEYPDDAPVQPSYSPVVEAEPAKVDWPDALVDDEEYTDEDDESEDDDE